MQRPHNSDESENIQPVHLELIRLFQFEVIQGQEKEGKFSNLLRSRHPHPCTISTGHRDQLTSSTCLFREHIHPAISSVVLDRSSPNKAARPCAALTQASNADDAGSNLHRGGVSDRPGPFRRYPQVINQIHSVCLLVA